MQNCYNVPGFLVDNAVVYVLNFVMVPFLCLLSVSLLCLLALVPCFGSLLWFLALAPCFGSLLWLLALAPCSRPLHEVLDTRHPSQAPSQGPM